MATAREGERVPLPGRLCTGDAARDEHVEAVLGVDRGARAHAHIVGRAREAEVEPDVIHGQGVNPLSKTMANGPRPG
jgi:hypothetical protein